MLHVCPASCSSPAIWYPVGLHRNLNSRHRSRVNENHLFNIIPEGLLSHFLLHTTLRMLEQTIWMFTFEKISQKTGRFLFIAVLQMILMNVHFCSARIFNPKDNNYEYWRHNILLTFQMPHTTVNQLPHQKNRGLLGCDAVRSCTWLPWFRKKRSHPLLVTLSLTHTALLLSLGEVRQSMA
jgi:hypothetical protein